MSESLLGFDERKITTSPAAPKTPLYFGLLATLAFATPTTAISQLPAPVVVQSWTTATQTTQRPMDNSGTVRRLKQRSGLSWRELADAFGVSRRSLHFWVNGGNMAQANIQRLQQLTGDIASFGNRVPALVRSELLRPDTSGMSQLDRWVAEATPMRVSDRTSPIGQLDLVHDTIQHRRRVVGSDAVPMRLRDY